SSLASPLLWRGLQAPEVSVQIGDLAVGQSVEEADRHERDVGNAALAHLVVGDALGRVRASLEDHTVHRLVDDDPLINLAAYSRDVGGAVAGGHVLARLEDRGEEVVAREAARDAVEVGADGERAGVARGAVRLREHNTAAFDIPFAPVERAKTLRPR